MRNKKKEGLGPLLRVVSRPGKGEHSDFGRKSEKTKRRKQPLSSTPLKTLGNSETAGASAREEKVQELNGSKSSTIKVRTHVSHRGKTQKNIRNLEKNELANQALAQANSSTVQKC